MKRYFILAFGLCLLFIPQSVSANIVINEFFFMTGSDWIELYNTSSVSASLAGMVIKDSAGQEIPLNGILEGGQYKVITTNKLNKDGDSLNLFDSGSNQTLESIAYGDLGTICIPQTDLSIGRLPDVSGNFTILSAPTEGLSNNSVSAVACVTPTVKPTATSKPDPTGTPTSSPKPSATPGPPVSTHTHTPTIVPSKRMSITVTKIHTSTPPVSSVPIDQAEDPAVLVEATETADVATASSLLTRFPFKAILALLLTAGGFGLLGVAITLKKKLVFA